MNNVVTHVTKACYQLSKLLQLRVQHIIERNLKYPKMNFTWIRQLFLLVQNTFPAYEQHHYVPDDLVRTYNNLFRSAIVY
jgi:hypothetical protein